jgi:UDP-N-acetylglucosamine 2-epimerase (non-hydrolysing)
MGPLIIVAGARPNFMKVAPILRAIEARHGRAGYRLVHSGQHYDFDMSGVFFEQLGIPQPDIHLEVGPGSHGVQTGKIMAAFEGYLVGLTTAPRGVVVVGDVNSTMGCALVAVKLGIPVAHVEAGLRSFDRAMPEEINRLVTDAVADVLLVSEPAGMTNLAREGIPAERIQYVGNVMIDTLIHELDAARALDVPARLGVPPGGYALVTLHRPSNVDDPDRLAALVGLLGRVAARLPVVFPVHPRTRKQLEAHGLSTELDAAGVRASTPFGYREFVGLMAAARVVASDSGGIQEETTYLGVPCVTLRTSTERPITITAGSNVLVGDDIETAWRAIADAIDGKGRAPQPIDGWDGHAADRVVAALDAAWKS